ncbi:MAG: hypothetical protein WCQ47_00460, partial [bacterium]
MYLTRKKAAPQTSKSTRETTAGTFILFLVLTGIALVITDSVVLDPLSQLVSDRIQRQKYEEW